MRNRRVVLVGVALLLLAAPAFAHGGQYRRPKPVIGPPPTEPEMPGIPGGGPSTGGEVRPGATTAGPEARLGPDDWAGWWATQRWRLLRGRPEAVETPSVRPSSDSPRAKAIATLLGTIHDPDEDIATGALVALGKIGDPSCEAQLVAVLRDGRRTQSVREAAACGLALLGRAPGGAEDARTALEAVVADATLPPRLRAIAAYALGLRGEETSFDLFASLIVGNRADPQVLAAAASSLGLLGTPDAIGLLRVLVDDGQEGTGAPTPVRVYAAHGLARAGAASGVAPLLRAVEDADPTVRRASMLALAALATAEDDDVQRALRKRLDTDLDVSCRDVAVLALGSQGHAKSRAVLDDALRGGRNVHASFASCALGLWARRQTDVSAAAPIRLSLAPRVHESIRGPACVALGLARDREAAPLLLRIVEGSGASEVRSLAAAVLPEIASREDAAPALRAQLRTDAPPGLRREAASALGALGDTEAAAVLGEMAARGEGLYERAAAMVALSRIGGPGASDHLLGTLRDPKADPLLRALAAVGLGILHERPHARSLSVVAQDLDWASSTDAVAELLTIL